MSVNFINAILEVVPENRENDCHTAEYSKDIPSGKILIFCTVHFFTKLIITSDIDSRNSVNAGVMYLKNVEITTMISFYGAAEMSPLKN